MAFSLFNKKPAEKVGQARPVARAPASGAAKASPAEVSPAKELPGLDFSGPLSLEGNDKPAAIQVQEVVAEVPMAVEQAAMLYSANQPIEACAVLEAAIRGRGLGRFAQRAWGMLFDLYQSLDKREAFEALALEFAGKFETSPPTWRVEAAEAKDPALATGGRAFVALTGSLNAKSQDSLKQLLKLAEKNPTVRLDLAKLADADDHGAALLLSALRVLRKNGKECVFGGADRLVALVSAKLQTGRREAENLWLLLLELHQQLFHQEAFDETAVNYAITFEVSPPSWDPKRAQRPAAEPSTVALPPAKGEGFPLEGDIASAGVGSFAPLTAYAEDKEVVIVDCSALLRMDFVSAAQLLNVLANLQAGGKKVKLRDVSHLIAALWEVIGLDRVACVETRKA